MKNVWSVKQFFVKNVIRLEKFWATIFSDIMLKFCQFIAKSVQQLWKNYLTLINLWPVLLVKCKNINPNIFRHPTVLLRFILSHISQCCWNISLIFLEPSHSPTKVYHVQHNTLVSLKYNPLFSGAIPQSQKPTSWKKYKCLFLHMFFFQLYLH